MCSNMLDTNIRDITSWNRCYLPCDRLRVMGNAQRIQIGTVSTWSRTQKDININD